MPLPPSPLLIAGWRTTTPFTRIPGWATAHPANTSCCLNPPPVRFNGVNSRAPRPDAKRARRKKGRHMPALSRSGCEYRMRSGHLAAGDDGELAALVPRRLALCLRRLFVLAPEIEGAGVEQAF